MKRMFSGFAALAFTAAVTSSAAAQAAMTPTSGGMQFGVFGGANLVQGDFKDAYKSVGFDAGAALAFNPAMLPFGVKISGTFERFSPKDEAKSAGVGNTSVIGGAANAVLKFPGAMVSPYVTAGIGFDHVKVSFDESALVNCEANPELCVASVRGAESSSSVNKFGANFGGGVQFQLAGMSTFLEATYKITFGDQGSKLKRIPINFGIMFPIGG